ncbi:MAG: HAMP domain-containing histidine kinase [Lachnospiraceae bacterium]|nr:HAMP domain-containing histidine kinase [Lachnospiraceae bacterium]MDE6976179.1 HAMP domain-containing histidine kinase [Lachnospiraceae bacterium]
MGRGTMARLEEMLDQAINGTFEERDYNETRLSRLETRWKRYLALSQVSQRRTREEQERVRGLISNISHQTKTPLANILLYSQLLREKEKDPELIPIVKKISDQSEKLDFLIRSLIKSSRLESELLVLHPKVQSIEPVLLAAMEQISDAALKKQVSLSFEGTDKAACFDRKWTEEAMENLLDNAVKYSPAGSRIEIGVTEYEMFTAVSVKDEGIGIGEEEQAQIFRRFYRGREVSQEPGVGIGLYLVREIAEKQGGYVKVKSKRGRGSVFYFYMARNGE